MEYKGTKRLTKDNGYSRPDKTYQDKLSNQEIKENVLPKNLRTIKFCMDYNQEIKETQPSE